MQEGLDPAKVTVVGSSNIDYYTRVERFPAAGETVMGEDLSIRFGGKGANQAVAAARLGAQVELVSCLGADEMGRRYRSRFSKEGIGVSGVELLEGIATGSAFITLDSRGENTIVVAPGANMILSVEHVRANAALLSDSFAVVLQNEIPHEANLEAMRIATEAGTPVVYNPAPWDECRVDALAAADVVVVNEGEAEHIPAELDVRRGHDGLLSGTRHLIITRGSASTLCYSGGEAVEVPTLEIDPVDTVGAGDAFVGALAVRLGEGAALVEAVEFANQVAARAILKIGAQESLPCRAEMRLPSSNRHTTGLQSP